jgi:hypothetical protein
MRVCPPAMKVCVYTAVYGGHDDLKNQPAQSISTDFVCFTDSSDLRPPACWKVIRNNRVPRLHPRMRAKYFKILSHRIFPNGRPSIRETGAFGVRRMWDRYDYVIWLDGNAQIQDADFSRKVISYVGASGWAMFPHPERDCIYDEVLQSATMPKYHVQPIHEQAASYRTEGYPAKNGLMACGLIARQARADLGGINEMWWRENRRWTYQDQLSLPVVLWRLGRGFDRIEKNLWHNDLISWLPHKSQD